MINISPSALKAFLACPRRWYLEFVARAPRFVPPYVTAGTDLDLAVQRYLRGEGTPGADGPDHVGSELECLRTELPAPGTVLVQHRPPSLPCPGLEDRARITTGGLDYMSPPNATLVVIGDLKRVWRADAAHSAETLADDVQAQLYAWLVWQAYAPAQVIWRWTYLVRGVVSREGKVTRKAKAFSVDVEADRARVDAWFERVLLPAARAMLEITGPVEAIEHDPESCDSGAGCFVRASCPMFTGPVRGQGEYHVDLSRFTIKQSERIAINPPALSRETDTAGTVLDVQAVDGEGADMVEVVAEAPETEPAPPPAETEPAEPAPPPAEDKPVRRRRARAEPAPPPAELRDALLVEVEQLRALNARQADMLALRSLAEDLTTEQLRDELIDRGYRVWLEARA